MPQAPYRTEKPLVAKNPETILGFTEMDEPNFSFRQPPCSFYSGTKALAEEVLRGSDQCYVWRLRIPFDEFDNPRNYLTKIQRYAKVYDNVNSISHRGDFVNEIVVDRDEPVLARLADGDDAGVGQDLQMVGDGWLRQMEVRLDLAARQLARGGNLARHPDAFLVRQRPERLDQPRFVHRRRFNISKCF